ncbi:MAG: ABC transporter ATP-binding protein [Arcobacteraceae bacterium]|jgi:phospholipid/cholesterol/gamma-HCH transport system ATP-binding protein
MSDHCIKIQNLRKVFGTKEILKNVNLDIKTGKCTAIFGLSGGGKSTIIKHIVGLLKPTSGEIFYNDIDISTLEGNELRAIRQDIGFLFQSGALFDSMNVFENVAFPLREHTKLDEKTIIKEVMEKLTLVGLDASRVAFLNPDELSGGMRKRVGLARTIILNPKVLLYDEPTSGLDPITSDVISQMIIALQKEMKTTSILISHDIQETFKTADYFAMLYGGVIVEYGDAEHFKNSKVDIVQKFLHGDSDGVI